MSSSRPCAPSLRKQVPAARPRSSSPCCSSPGAAADGKGVWGRFAAVCQSTPSCPEKMRDAGWSSSCGRGAPPPPRQHRTLLPGAGFGPSEATGGDKFPRRLCQVLGRKRSHRTLLRLRAQSQRNVTPFVSPSCTGEGVRGSVPPLEEAQAPARAEPTLATTLVPAAPLAPAGSARGCLPAALGGQRADLNRR